MKAVYRKYDHKTGPGGFACPCCNPYHCHPRKAKPLSRRLVRRAMKMEVQKMALEA